MTTLPAPVRIDRCAGEIPFDGWPRCTICDRLVDSVATETPIETIDHWNGPVSRHTGEIIITIECHGETWKVSNWRGRLA